MKTAIVTDSNSGIFEEEGRRLGVFVLPMPVLIDSNVYFEGKNLFSAQFYQYLQEGRDITTSQPSPGDLTALWEQVLELGYDELVYIPMSSGLSSSCATAKMLAEDYDGKVFVADNHRISVTQRYSVLDALALHTQAVMDGRSVRSWSRAALAFCHLHRCGDAGISETRRSGDAGGCCHGCDHGNQTPLDDPG